MNMLSTWPAVWQSIAGSPLVKGIAKVIAKHPDADIGNAFNHKQVACKMWARDKLFESVGGVFGEIWIVGGWYGVFAAMLLEDPRFQIGRIENSDIDPGVGAIAETLNHAHASAVRAQSPLTCTRWTIMRARADLVVNTSCEHIPDLREWLAADAEGPSAYCCSPTTISASRPI